MSADSAWIYSGPNAGKVIVYKFETTDPTTLDDISAGFIVTSRWINTSTQDEWVCLDNSLGAAIWKSTTTGGGGGGGVTYGAATSLVVGGGNVNGVLSTVSRSDHKHALPAFGTTAGTFAEGDDSRFSDSRTPLAHASSHLPSGSDPLTTAIAGSIQPDDAAAVGTANSFSRSDHKHSIVAAAAGAATPGDAAAEGVATSFARSDHKHSLPSFGSSAGTFTEGNDSRLSDARSPTAHASTHLPGGTDALTTAAAGAIQPDDAAAEGAATSFARSDHKHSIVAAAAGAATPGDAADEGAATSFARSDHKHSLPAYGSSAGTFCQGNDSRLSDARTPTGHHTSHESGGGDAIKLDDLAAPDDNTDLNASVSAHGLLKKLSNDSSQFLNGTGAWSSPGVGGVSLWYPDAPPSSPHSCDDEMNGSVVNAKWTELDPANQVTWSMDTTAHMLKAVGTDPGTGNTRLSGLYQAVPASEFTIYTRCSNIYSSTVAKALDVGIFVSEDLAANPTTADLRAASLFQFNTGRGVRNAAYAAYNGAVTVGTSYSDPQPYLRIRCNGTAYVSDVSFDGISWFLLQAVTLGFTPAHFGVFIAQAGSGAGPEATGYWKFFRCFSGAGVSGYNATRIGRYV
jgi:hypothetical protein